MAGSFTTLDFAVLVLYLGGVTIWGAWLGRGQKGGVDYFLGSRSMPAVECSFALLQALGGNLKKHLDPKSRLEK